MNANTKKSDATAKQPRNFEPLWYVLQNTGDILLGKSCDPDINFFQHDMNIQNLNKPYISSVIRQKVESQKGCLKKTKHAKFSEKMSIYRAC